MAREYFDAGSDMVLTASFGGSRFMLEKYGHGDRVRELNRLAAEHARSQAPPNGLVAGSVGPTGEFIEPLGEVSQAEMLDAFVEQITALEEGGADAVVIETMFALDETRLGREGRQGEYEPGRHRDDDLRQGAPRLLYDDGSDSRGGRTGAS